MFTPVQFKSSLSMSELNNGNPGLMLLNETFVSFRKMIVYTKAIWDSCCFIPRVACAVRQVMNKYYTFIFLRFLSKHKHSLFLH